MSNREEFEYEAGQELKLPVSIIKQARMGDGYDHAFDSMSVMQPLSQWWHWWQAGREGMDKKFTDMAVQLANAESKFRDLSSKAMELVCEASLVYSKYNDTQMPDRDLVDMQTLQEMHDLCKGAAQ